MTIDKGQGVYDQADYEPLPSHAKHDDTMINHDCRLLDDMVSSPNRRVSRFNI